MIDVIVVRRGRFVERRIKKMESGNIEDVDHLPWFVTTEPIYDPRVVGCKEIDVAFYTFNERTWRYEKRFDRSYIVYVKEPYLVREVSGQIAGMRKPVSMNNIRYEARLSMDVSDTLFGVRVPIMIHYDPSDLASIAEELYEKSRNIKILGFDIEVKAEGSFPRPGSEVFIVSMCEGEIGSDREECWILETEQVADFIKYVRQSNPIYLVGFNSSGFDIPYLVSYLQDIREILRPQGVVMDTFVVPHVDAMEIVYRHASSFGLPFGARLALDDIAQRLGLAKPEEIEIESSIDRNRIWSEYQRNRERVLRYAETDARLTLRLGKQVLRVLIQLYALTGISPSVVQLLPTVGSIAEYAVLEYLFRKKRMVLELRWKRYTQKELRWLEGFYRKGTKNFCVRDRALFENVAYYDFDMLYPTIYYEYRLDPTTVEIGSGFKVYLLDEERKKVIPLIGRCYGGPVNEALSYFYVARRVSKRLKKEKEKEFEELDKAVKILANSAYGMFSKVRGCGVNEFISAFIFFKGNQILKNIRGWIDSTGRKVIYGDTDSFFVVLKDGDDPEKLADEITRIARARFGKNFSVKLETICHKMVIITKKSYVCVTDDEVIVKGLERLEIPVAIKERIGEIFERVIEGEDPEKLVKKILEEAPIRDLFVKASKRMSELVDEEKDRFKELNSNRTKAVLLRYLLDSGVKLSGKVPFQIYRDALEDFPVVAYYLRYGEIGGSVAIALLVEEREDEAIVARCALASRNIGKDVLEGFFVCREEVLSKEKVIRIALSTMSKLMEYLKIVHSLVKKGGGLDRWVRR